MKIIQIKLWREQVHLHNMSETLLFQIITLQRLVYSHFRMETSFNCPIFRDLVSDSHMWQWTQPVHTQQVYTSGQRIADYIKTNCYRDYYKRISYTHSVSAQYLHLKTVWSRLYTVLVIWMFWSSIPPNKYMQSPTTQHVWPSLGKGRAP